MDRRFIIHAGGIPWQQRFAKALSRGLKDTGHEVWQTNDATDTKAGTHILLGPNLWGRTFASLTAAGRDFLVVNRAFLGEVLGHAHIEDPHVSIGWNGFNNKARFAFAYGDELPYSRVKPELLYDFGEWRDDDNGGVLILLEYDTSERWLNEVIREIKKSGQTYRHRCHPNGRNTVLGPSRRQSPQSLAEDARRSAVAVTHHSTAAVEVLLRGTPVVSYNDESMTWPITGHSLDDIRKSDRTEWLQWLAWTQWKVSEIEKGEPWEWLLN